MAGKSRSSTVRVRAVRSTDLMNEGEVAELQHDQQVDNMITSGHLVKVDKDEPVTTASQQDRAVQPDDGSRPL